MQHLSSSAKSFDAQVRVAPVSRLDLFLGTSGIPSTIAFLVLFAASSVIFVPVISAAAGAWNVLAYLFLLEAGFFYGAAFIGESLTRAVSGQVKFLLALPVLGGVWLAVGKLAGDSIWVGMFDPVGQMLVGLRTGAGWMFGVCLISFFATTVVLWAALSSRPEPPGRKFVLRIGERTPFPDTYSGAIAVAVSKNVLREEALQRHWVFVLLASGVPTVAVALTPAHLAPLAVAGRYWSRWALR